MQVFYAGLDMMADLDDAKPGVEQLPFGPFLGLRARICVRRELCVVVERKIDRRRS